ncbi:hypothetical protein L228DRAFT_60247 [Xylona heveae TC161]|uniref:Uncharacterized protein n=1 Tax=Xylona heveae (strain CBS 132557 / TC161) TaxID=1328760 RepID=A0A165IKC4_XYLHT|nr:hypothetical protein L228DRAFT_60247 [Xylona heveae TC161]KZF25018.1 hypothetical protein L228DRAFT_60247 [Xylona heveae TC161]
MRYINPTLFAASCLLYSYIILLFQIQIPLLIFYTLTAGNNTIDSVFTKGLLRVSTDVVIKYQHLHPVYFTEITHERPIEY